jgi:prepilin-type N-terminal cleavage/methylation domain-containing protein
MKRSAGFSLIEMLVAIAITAIVIAVSLAILNEGQRTSEGISLSSNTLQNLRAGMNYLVRDLVLAGEGLPTGGIPIPNGSGTPVNRPGPTGSNYTFPNTYTAIPVLTTGGGKGPNVLRPTDMVTVIYADNTLPLNQNLINDPNPPVTTPPTTPCNGSIDSNGASVTFDINCTNISTGTTRIQPGDLIMFSNSNGNALASVTSVAGQKLNFAASDPFNLNQRTDSSGTMKQIQAPPSSGNYPPTTATRVVMLTYYLDNSDPQNPRLMRQLNFNAALAVSEGIEDLQVSYDFVDGATNPSDQKDPPAGNSPNQIQNANLFLAGRSLYRSTWTKQYFRNNLVTQVAPRSLKFFNRYQ